METHFNLSDDALAKQLKNASLDVTLFNHETHLRFAWIHLKKYGLEKAQENVSSQILNYVTILGAKDKFHMTLTIAAVKVVFHFMQKSDTTTFADFITAFPRLKTDFEDLVKQHYQADIFNTAEARNSYVEPDLIPFD